MRGTYLYAIMAGGYRLDLGRRGLPDGTGRVCTLPTGGIAGVVGEYDGQAFGDLAKADLLRRLSIHQAVIECVMRQHAVLPVKFGTVLASETEVRKAIDRWQGRLITAFMELGNAVEVELATTWELREVFAEIARQPEISELAAAAAARPEEEARAMRIEVGKLVKEALDRRREKYRQRLLQDLGSFARAARPNPLPSDEFVSNVAFLVEQSQLDAFRAGVYRLDEEFGGRLTLRLVGPLPPYSFGTVQIDRPNADEVEAARQLLDLGEWVSEAELNATFRRLAAFCHPDRNPGDPTAHERFIALGAAHSKLLDYVRGKHRGEAEGDERHRCDLSRSAVESWPFLTIRRSNEHVNPLGEMAYGRQNG